MTLGQATVFGILGATIVLFIWGRWRYDAVAMMALLAVLLTGVLPLDQAFTGFANPAVITVAAVLVISRALQQAGLVDVIVRVLAQFKGRPTAQIVTQTAIVALLSSVMNNVGALALMMPVALRQAYRDGYSPAIVLMPLAFGSLLGGMTTLIGTPPNMLVSNFRAATTGEPFGMFAFSPVGVAVAVAGVAFITLVGWRLIPKNRRAETDPDKLFEIADYAAELRVPLDSVRAGATVRDIEALADGKRSGSANPSSRIRLNQTAKLFGYIERHQMKRHTLPGDLRPAHARLAGGGLILDHRAQAARHLDAAPLQVGEPGAVLGRFVERTAQIVQRAAQIRQRLDYHRRPILEFAAVTLGS